MISIIIPTYNSENTIGKLLKSILNSDHDKHEIIVVDGGSSDKTTEIVKKFKNVRLIKQKKNFGNAHARNTGAKYSKGDILLFFDSDVVVHKDTIKKFKKILKNKNIKIIQGIYSKNSLTKGLIPEYKCLLDYYGWLSIKTNEVTSLEPRCCTIRKDVFNKVGGFDTKIKGATVEDYDLGYRLIKNNYKILVDKSIQVDHHFPTSFKKLIKIFFKRGFHWVKLFLKRKKFDNVATTPTAGLSRGLAFLSFLLIFLSFYSNMFFYISLVIFLLYITLISDFISLIFKEKGLKFTFLSIIVDYMLSITLCFASLFAVISHYFGRNKYEI